MAGGLYEDESQIQDDFYEDDVIPKVRTRRPHVRGGRGRKRILASASEQYRGWKNVDGTEFNVADESEEEEDEDYPYGKKWKYIGKHV